MTPRLLPLAGPLYAELLLGMLVALVCTALAARGGEASGAAFALASQLAAMLFILFRIVGAGLSVVVAQALGSGQTALAARTARAALGAASWIGGGCGLLAIAFAEPLLRLMQAPPDVLPLALPLLQWLGAAVLLDAWNTSLAGVLRAHLQARATMGVVLLMQASHLALAWPLMAWPWAGGAAWALQAYAVALLASRLLGAGLLLRLWQQTLGLAVAPAHFGRIDRAALGPVLRLGLPGAAENIAWRLAYMVSLAVVGGLGTAALATHAYTMQVQHVLLLSALAMGLSVEILAGRLVGAGQLGAANALVRQAMARSLALSGLLSLGAALAGPWLIGLFSQDPQVLRDGSRLLWLAVLVETGRSFNLVMVNALRATGDARYPVAAGAASFALVMAGGSWWLGAHLGWGLAGIWLAYAADEWLRGLLMWRRWVRLRWLPHARQTRRAQRRAAQDTAVSGP